MAFDYTVVRSKRKSLTVSVSENNVITVRCPNSMKDWEIEAFINSKAKWLNNVLAENDAKRAYNGGILNYSEILVGGQKCPLIFCERNKIENGTVYVKNIPSIKKILTKYFAAELLNFANYISSQVNLHASDFSLRSYKSRWGCCERKGAITFNCLLIMLPMYLQRYVIIHELCHTVHFDHSQKFWNLVAKFEPNYKLYRKNLKNFNYLTKLY